MHWRADLFRHFRLLQTFCHRCSHTPVLILTTWIRNETGNPPRVCSSPPCSFPLSGDWPSMGSCSRPGDSMPPSPSPGLERNKNKKQWKIKGHCNSFVKLLFCLFVCLLLFFGGRVLKTDELIVTWNDRLYYTDIDRDGHEISRFGGLPRELYFPKGLYFHEVRSTEGKYCLEGKYNYLGTTDTWYFIRPGRYLLY